MTFSLYNVDDWMALYAPNGELLYQYHNIPALELINLLKGYDSSITLDDLHIENHWLDDNDNLRTHLNKGGRFPQKHIELIQLL